MSLNLNTSRVSSLFFSGYLLFAFTATGCGSSQQQTPGINQTHDALPSGPTGLPLALLPIEDPSCFTGSSSQTITSADIISLQEGTKQSIVENLSDAVSTDALHGDFIDKTSYGLAADLSCTQDATGSHCDDSLTVTRSAGNIKICRAAANYSATSLEGAALTSFYHIDHLFRFYTSITAGSNAEALPKVRLLLLPSLTERFPNSSQLRQDNISYYTEMQGVPTIAIFPKGAAGESLWPTIDLWDSAWVLGHESSHHIFHVLMAAANQKTGPNILALAAQNASGTDSSTAASAYLPSIVTAVNESFADLFSYLSLGADSTYIRGLSCFAETRDVGSNLYSDNTQKQLTRENLNTFLSPYVAGNSPCDINFHDPHVVGAIFAHTLNLLFHGASGVAQAQNPHQEAAKLALKWVSLMPFHVTNIVDPTLITRDLLDAALNVAAVGNSLSKAQCQAVTEGFPVFADWWFAGSAPRFICK